MHLSPARILNFIRREAVLCCAALAALASTLFVPPSAAYISYFDFRVLCLLFCLMAVVAGLRGCGLFEALALRLLRGKKTLRFLALMLVRIAERKTNLTWDKIRTQMERLHLIEFFSNDGRVLQTTEPTKEQLNIFKLLKISPPRRMQDIQMTP